MTAHSEYDDHRKLYQCLLWLDNDKKTPHMCKGIQQQNTIQVVKELPQTTRIDELAVTRTAAFEIIAAALEKNNNQNVADAIYYLAESITSLVKVLTEEQTGK